MRDQAAVARLLHVGLVDVVRREIARDAGEQIDVAFAHGLGERCRVADRDVEVTHAFRPCGAGLCIARQLPYKFPRPQRIEKFSDVTPTRIAVIGAGLIGRKHLSILKGDPAFEIAGIADPAPAAEDYAREQGFRYFKDTESLLDGAKPDGVVIANPNVLHRATALACIARKTPAIVEKPVADTLGDALAIVRAAQVAKVPMLTGHHRRHNPIMQAARDFVAGGALGKLAVATGTWLHRKPDDYYNVGWRCKAGGGPIL